MKPIINEDLSFRVFVELHNRVLKYPNNPGMWTDIHYFKGAGSPDLDIPYGHFEISISRDGIKNLEKELLVFEPINLANKREDQELCGYLAIIVNVQGRDGKFCIKMQEKGHLGVALGNQLKIDIPVTEKTNVVLLLPQYIWPHNRKLMATSYQINNPVRAKDGSVFFSFYNNQKVIFIGD